MSTDFPEAIDTFPTAEELVDDTLATNPHSTLHGNLGDALEAVQGVIVGPVFHNVKAYGAVGDNATDDTASIQAAMDAVTTGGAVFFPTGIYKVTSTLNLPDVRGFRMIGASMQGAEIRMATNNTVIISTNGNQFVNSIEIAELKLAYASQQNNASHPNSIAIELRSNGLTCATYYSTFRRLFFNQCTYGIKAVESGGGTMQVWADTFEDLVFEYTAHSLIYINTIGNPCNHFRRIASLFAPAGGTTGTAMVIATEAVLDCIDIEDWTGNVVDLAQGPIVVNGLHIERWTATTGQWCISLNACAWSCDGLSISGDVPVNVNCLIFQVVANSGGNRIGPAQIALTDGGASNSWVYVVGNGNSDQSYADVAYPYIYPATMNPAFFLYQNASSYKYIRGQAGGAGVQTVVSTTTVTVYDYGTTFFVSGTTTIQTIVASWQERQITLIPSANVTVVDGSNLRLAGNFVGTSDDCLTLICDGTNWYERARSAN